MTDILSKLLSKPQFAAQVKAQTEGTKSAVPFDYDARPKKYRNKPIEFEGERFDSTLEFNVCEHLRARYGRERIVRQVSIPIGSKRIRPDFMIVHKILEDGLCVVEFADAKGHETRECAAKLNHLKNLHGITVRLIRNGKG